MEPDAGSAGPPERIDSWRWAYVAAAEHGEEPRQLHLATNHALEYCPRQHRPVQNRTALAQAHLPTQPPVDERVVRHAAVQHGIGTDQAIDHKCCRFGLLPLPKRALLTPVAIYPSGL